MSELSSSFTREDIETLIESVGDWESVGNHEYHVLSMIKSAPMPPDDHEAFEPMTQIKDYFKSREKEILASRALRQEKAVFLKAKLMMVRRDLSIGKLFDMAAKAQDNGGDIAPEESGSTVFVPEGNILDLQRKLQLAEDFIKDMGVVSYYEKFVAERTNSSSQSKE